MDKLRLLIAEDNKLIRSLYKKGLSEEDFEMRFAGDGEEAMEIYKSWRPDIVLLDIVMPVMTGYEVLKNIREEEPAQNSPDRKDNKKSTVVIMATSMDSKDDIMDCVKLGINGYLVKPLNHRKINDQILGYYRKATSK